MLLGAMTLSLLRSSEDQIPLVRSEPLRRSIETGKRNTSIFRVSLEQAVHSDDFESLLDVMRTRNMLTSPGHVPGLPHAAKRMQERKEYNTARMA
jgi:hypothetical protein